MRERHQRAEVYIITCSDSCLGRLADTKMETLRRDWGGTAPKALFLDMLWVTVSMMLRTLQGVGGVMARLLGWCQHPKGMETLLMASRVNSALGATPRYLASVPDDRRVWWGQARRFN
jgi:hypothetical protein